MESSVIEALTSTAAIGLSSTVIVASLVKHLRRNGVLSDTDEREIYEFARYMLEQEPAGDSNAVIAMARKVIEEHLNVNE